jgi:hypothetical protein
MVKDDDNIRAMTWYRIMVAEECLEIYVYGFQLVSMSNVALLRWNYSDLNP